MRLLEIEVRHWRGLTLKLQGLSSGLNLILGANESGKSRLFQAIRYGLFESCKGAAQHKQLLQSWSSTEPPFVRIVFSEGAEQFELEKQFLRSASARLAGGGRTLTGEDAEESLRQLLGARQGNSRGAEVANLGIWPLLMVAQGESRKTLQTDLNDDGRGRLQERLSKEIGIAAVSAAGQRLMELVEREYGRFFTATGQEARVLRDCRAALDTAKLAAKDALIARQRQEQTATALAENRRELADLELRLGTAKHDADMERIRADAASAASGRVAVAQGNLEIAKQRVVSAEALLNTRIEVDAAIDRLNSEFAALDLRLAQRLSGQGNLETALQSAESALAAADGLVRAARAELDTAQREQKRQGLAASREALIDKIKRLEQLEAATQQARSTRAGLPSMDAKALARLKTLDRELRSAVAQLQGAAVRVVVHVHESVSVDGAQRSAGERVQIDIVEDRRVAIGGIAEVEIQPGGGELERLRQARVTADSTLASALKALNATDLDDASSIHEQILELDRLIADLGRQAQATTAKQLSELCEDLLRIDADLTRLGPEQRISSTEAELSASLAALDATLTKDRSTRDAASGSLAEFRSGTAALAAKAETTRAEHQRLARLYAERPTAAELRSGHTLVVAERQNAQSSLAIAQEEFSDLGGAGVQEDARRLELSAEALANRVRASRSTGDQLRGALNGMMDAGNYETVEQSEALVEQSQMQWQRLRQQADAAQRLWQVLGDSRQRVIEKLTAPVTERVRPYLREIFPGSTLDAGDGFDVMGLQSGNLREPFTELSGGAQEQISLLTRIGIAEVLAGEGTLPLILDDVLINTDPERIRRMHRALFRASERLQIMVFSCHDVLFDGLGAEFVVKLDRGRH
jgi:DNA repair exonuclease SbcCD ATPase subunit